MELNRNRNGQNYKLVNIVGNGMVPEPDKVYEDFHLTGAGNARQITLYAKTNLHCVLTSFFAHQGAYIKKITLDDEVIYSSRVLLQTVSYSKSDGWFNELTRRPFKKLQVHFSDHVAWSSFRMGWSDVEV